MPCCWSSSTRSMARRDLLGPKTCSASRRGRRATSVRRSRAFSCDAARYSVLPFNSESFQGLTSVLRICCCSLLKPACFENILSLLEYNNDVVEKADQLSRRASSYITRHDLISSNVSDGDVSEDANRLQAAQEALAGFCLAVERSQ